MVVDQHAIADLLAKHQPIHASLVEYHDEDSDEVMLCNHRHVASEWTRATGTTGTRSSPSIKPK